MPNWISNTSFNVSCLAGNGLRSDLGGEKSANYENSAGRHGGFRYARLLRSETFLKFLMWYNKKIYEFLLLSSKMINLVQCNHTGYRYRVPWNTVINPSSQKKVKALFESVRIRFTWLPRKVLRYLSIHIVHCLFSVIFPFSPEYLKNIPV